MKKFIECKIFDKSNKVACMVIGFNTTYKKCVGFNDDRKLYCVMVDNLYDAVVEFESLIINNPIIKVAFNEYYHKKETEIYELEESLRSRLMI